MSPTGSPARLGAENDGLDTEAASRSDGQSESISERRPWVKCQLYACNALKATLYCSYANALLVFVPLGVVAGALGWNSAAIFILNFLAIFPLAALLSYSTEELSAHVGQTFGGLINATFGNAVEMIVSRPCSVSLSYLWLTCVRCLRLASLP
jgi:Ca2+:H+ antiporter